MPEPAGKVLKSPDTQASPAEVCFHWEVWMYTWVRLTSLDQREKDFVEGGGPLP